MKYICALITVSDLKRSRDFYEKLLNQKVKFDLGENITFQGDFALHLESHYKGLIGNKAIKHGGNNFELYFEDDNVEQTVKLLKENNVAFVHEIREQPWRQKVVRFYDPDKNIIEIGETMEHLVFRLKEEGLSLEQIAKMTNLPIEFVSELIENYQKVGA